ncbi:MAG TPA: glycosyltransferase family 39 protein [Burkholderiales bacterium]|nr:glycosyltransferase family 39 protein [Burkholderiales bacterium]
MPSDPPITHPAPAVSRPLIALTVLAVVLSFFFALGRAPLFDVDEGAFSQATMEMFERGDFLSTYLNGEPRYDKPILVYWLQAGSVLLFGVNEFAFRFPSALCASLWVLLTFLFARRRFGPNAALLASGVMATSLGVYIIGRAATADALLNMLIAASMFAAWLYLETRQRTWSYATFAAVGLGFLAKGPVAILIPLAVTFVFCWLRRDLKTWALAIFDWRGLLVFVAVALPWYAFILHREGWPFVQGFFLKHNVGRFGGTLQGHAGSLVYYIPTVLIGTLPFTAFLLRAVLRVRAAWRDDLQCYLWLWFGFVFVFFSLSGTKLPHYMLYGMTGMFILMAIYGPEWRSRFWALLPALLFYLFLLALPAIVDNALPWVDDAYYREAVAGAKEYFGPGYLAFAAAAVLLTAYFMLERRFDLSHKLVVSGIVAVVGLSAYVVPVGAGVQQEPIKQAGLLARAKGYRVVMWRLNAPSFSVYYGRPTPNRDPRPGDIVITKGERLAELPGYGFDVIYAKNGIVLVRVTG